MPHRTPALGKIAERTATEIAPNRPRQLALAKARAAAQAQRLRLLLLTSEVHSLPSIPVVAGDGAVVRVDLYDIHVDRKRFQNRDEAHSTESVDRIVGAVLNNTFSWGLFDPILLWRDPSDKRLYILSGHSRRAAFVNLRDLFGRTEFATIPAKILTVPEKEALALARNSNTLSTKETPAERAGYYRNRRAEGVSRKDLETEATTNEGRNASVVLALSYLNPTGAALDLVRATQGSEVTGAQNALTLGTWLGEARRRYPELSNAHETELFDWLRGGAYGTSSGQISTKPDFLNRVAALILKNTVWGAFEATAPLNPLGRAAKSAVEIEQDAAEREARRAVADAEGIYQEKLRDYATREKDRAKLEVALAPYHTAIRAAHITLQQVIARRDTVKQALRTQTSLFGVRKGRKSGSRAGLRGIETDTFDYDYQRFQTGQLPSNYLFRLGMPSALLQSAGVPDLPIVLTQSVVKKATGEGKNKQDRHHAFLATDLVELTDYLASPVAVLLSLTQPDSVLIVTESAALSDQLMVVALKLNTRLDRLEVNEIRSIHGRDKSRLRLLLGNATVLYCNNEKAEGLELSGVQFPAAPVASATKITSLFMQLVPDEYGLERIDYREAAQSGLLARRQKSGLGRTTTPDAIRVDIYQRITDKLVSLMEASGELPWQKPFNGQAARYANIPLSSRHINLSRPVTSVLPVVVSAQVATSPTPAPSPDRSRQLLLARARANAQHQRLRLLALTR